MDSIQIDALIAGHPTAGFAIYLALSMCAWGASLWIYEKCTPCREWDLVRQGNKAAAWSLSGVALGLALPLASLALRSQSLAEMALWSGISVGAQLLLWFVLAHGAFKSMKSDVERGVESVGIVLGAMGLAFGALVAACVG